MGSPEKNFINCSDCEWESRDEMWDDNADTYMWKYFCRKANDRKISLDENEWHPDWCPKLKEQK